MGRKKKLVNNTDIPQYAIERVARCVLDDIREDYLKEEVLKAFVQYDEECPSLMPSSPYSIKYFKHISANTSFPGTKSKLSSNKLI